MSLTVTVPAQRARAAITARLANNSNGFNSVLRACIAAADPATKDKPAPFAIDFSNDSLNFLHGKYDVPKELDLELLSRIRGAIERQISLHGGSGTPLHYFEDASKQGVSKININTDMRIVFRDTLEQVLRDNPDEYAVVKLMPTVYEAVQKVVEEKISAFGSSGKAVR